MLFVHAQDDDCTLTSDFLRETGGLTKMVNIFWSNVGCPASLSKRKGQEGGGMVKSRGQFRWIWTNP